VPGFIANCQFTRFIAGLSLWQNFGYPALLFLPFTAGSGSALLIAAVDLSPGFLQLSVKIFLLKGKERIDKRLTGSGLAWGRGASQIVYGHSFKPLSHS